MSLFRRLRKLAAEPAFRADPARVVWRAGILTGSAAFRRRPVFSLTRFGERLRPPLGLRYTAVTAFLLRDWVEPELRELDQLLRPGDVFIDVGANIGLYSLKGARLVGQAGRVLALEPGREAFDHLTDNLLLNAFTWVEPLRLAASDRNGTAVLHHVPLGHDPQAFSLVPNERAIDGEQVETITLDRLTTIKALSRIDLIKIDVEGAEPMVIAGARDVLARLRPAILFECNAHLNAGGQGGAAGEAWDLLAECGYRFLRLRDGAFVPISQPPEDFCNLLAVHKLRQTALG